MEKEIIRAELIGASEDEVLLLSTSFCSFDSDKMTVFSGIEIVQDVFNSENIVMWVFDPLSNWPAKTYDFQSPKSAYKFLIDYISKNAVINA